VGSVLGLRVGRDNVRCDRAMPSLVMRLPTVPPPPRSKAPPCPVGHLIAASLAWAASRAQPRGSVGWADDPDSSWRIRQVGLGVFPYRRTINQIRAFLLERGIAVRGIEGRLISANPRGGPVDRCPRETTVRSPKPNAPLQIDVLIVRDKR
jgi:hypothetical protein